MKVANWLVDALERESVQYVFAVPGEETLDFMAALQDSSIRFIVTRHEQGAAFMAATWGRLSNQPGVCLTTLGPGALNTMTAIAHAYLGQMPMFVISGQKPIEEVKQGNFQMVDVIDSMQPITLLSQRLMKPAATPALFYQAWHTASDEPPGPVHLELAEDMAKKSVPESWQDLIAVKQNRQHRVTKDELENVLTLINSAESPLLVCGQHSSKKELSQELKQFVKTTGIPFVTTQMAKGAVDETHALYLGTTALSESDFVHKSIEQADVLIIVGHNESEKPPFIACHFNQNIIHVSASTPALNETYFPSHALVGDCINTIRYFSEKVKPRTSHPYENLQTQFKRHEQQLMAYAEPLQIVQQVRSAMPARGIVTLDNGMYKIWFTRHYRAQQPNTLLLDNALATMGAGLPSAIAAKLMKSELPVVAVCGDGGFMMTCQELETAVRLQLDLVIIVLRDNQFGMIRWKQQMDGYKDFGMDFGNPDFPSLAKSFGAHGQRVNDINQLSKVIKTCQSKGGVHLLEVPIDYNADEIFSRLDEIVSQSN